VHLSSLRRLGRHRIFQCHGGPPRPRRKRNSRPRKLAFAEGPPRARKRQAAAFLRRVLADKGTPFGTRPHQGDAGRPLFDRVCHEHGLDHRFTQAAPLAQWPGRALPSPAQRGPGQRDHSQTTTQLNEHLQTFSLTYHHGKRLKRLRGLTPHEFVCQQGRLHLTIFIHDPTHLTLALYN